MTNILPGTLQDIYEKVRIVAALGNSSQATDAEIAKRLNSYYLYDLPQDLRILKLKDVYTFNTIQGVDTYPFDFINWSTIQPPAYSGKQQMAFYQDPALFYGSSFNLQVNEQFDTADGTAGPYSGTTNGSPILRSVNNNPMTYTNTAPTSVFPTGYPPNQYINDMNNMARIQQILITANTATGTVNVTDDGAGNLIGSCQTGGTINYQTGAISNLIFGTYNSSLVFTAINIPSGNPINIQYKAITLGQPFSMLFFQQQFILRPVPDKGYTIEVLGYRTPSQALMGTNNPNELNFSGVPEDFEWWELIAFGTAKKFYQERLDMNGVAMMQQFIEEKVSDARTNTYGQLSKQRVPNIFQDQAARLVDYGYNTGYAFGNSVNS